MEVLGLRVAKLGGLHLTEKSAGSVASLGMLDWPTHAVNSAAGHAVLLKLKSVIKRLRNNYSGIGAPAE